MYLCRPSSNFEEKQQKFSGKKEAIMKRTWFTPNRHGIIKGNRSEVVAKIREIE